MALIKNTIGIPITVENTPNSPLSFALSDDDDKNVPKKKMTTTTTITTRRLRLPFVRQKRSWDCGLVCALMILRELGAHRNDTQRKRRRGRDEDDDEDDDDEEE